MLNHTPWLEFPKTEWPSLKSDLVCEVAIVGGGISGVTTLYYLLTGTDKYVVLLEKDKIASGATGHNAGLAIAYIEKTTSELIDLFGKEATQTIYKELNDAWDDLHAMHKKIAFDDNLLSFPYVINGFDSLPCFIAFVKNVILRDDQSEWRYLVTENLKSNIPQELFPIIEFVPHDTVLIALKTIDPKYIAATMRSSLFKAKRMNSAQFCYKVLDYLQEKFAGRFSVYEQTDITKIRLYEDQSILEHADGNIASQEVVLCTNAYKHFSIWDEVNQRAFTKLHETITPRIGYLAAFPNPSPERYALGFFNEKEDVNPVPFWYFSHAPHPNHNPNHSCVIGGPEFVFEGTCTQDWIENKAELSLEFIHHFLKTTFQEAPDTLPFFWHGWMAYTPDGLRWVGPDSDHPHLWYNLGCNGIGIVPAITGAKKIASFMRNALNTSQFNH